MESRFTTMTEKDSSRLHDPELAVNSLCVLVVVTITDMVERWLDSHPALISSTVTRALPRHPMTAKTSTR